MLREVRRRMAGHDPADRIRIAVAFDELTGCPVSSPVA